jgi:signal transduction histidine kinase
LKKIGIHIRLLLAVIVLVGATTCTIGYIGLGGINDFVSTRFQERMAYLSRYLAMNAELGILIDEKALLKRVADRLLQEKDVSGVRIFNHEGTLLTDEARKLPGPLAVVEQPVILREFPEEDRVLTGPHATVIGRVQLTYSREGIRHLVHTLKKRFLIWAAGLAALFCLIFYVISRSIVAPLTYLARMVRQVSYGDTDLRVHPGSLPETRELSLAFNDMLDSLERSREALREAHKMMTRQATLAEIGKFSMMIAHEVKNPLSIINSSLNVMKTELSIPDDHLMICYIDDEVKRLNRLIEDFLMFARPSKPRFQPADLNQMLEHVVSMFIMQYSAEALSFRHFIPEKPFRTAADTDLLSRAISNIVKNACEANNGRGIIDIRVDDRDDCWILEVRDEGDGVHPEDIDRIFEPFYTTRSKGTGLGLAFARQVIRAHGGHITVENIEAGGALFTVSIPAGKGKACQENTGIMKE